MKFLNIIVKSVVDFFRDGGFILAGSIAYFTMMALFPFCLFLITLFGHFLGHYPEFYKFFLNRLVSLFPSVTGEISNEILKLISYRGIGKFSLLLYGLLSYSVFGSVEHAMNVIFRVTKKRNIIFSLIISLIVVTLIIALIILSFAAASVFPLLEAMKPFLPALRIGRFTGFIIRFVFPFIMVLFTVTAIYRLIPKAKVKLSNAFKGATFTTLFLEIAKHVFTWYVSVIVHFGRIYGPLTAFVLFLLWTFYSCSIFLIGAEVVHNLGTSRKS